MELQSHHDELRDAGAVLWAISGDDEARLISFAEAEGLEFPILHDPGGVTFGSYGVLNERDDRTIPHPTVIIVDRDRVARLVVSDENYRVRVPTASIVAEVERMFANAGE